MGFGLPSKQTVNAVSGREQARNVRVVVDVVTDHVTSRSHRISCWARPMAGSMPGMRRARS